MDIRGKARVGDGSEAAPSWTFRLDPDTGIYRPGTNRLTIVTAGADRWEVDANGHLIPSDDDSYDIGDATHRVRQMFLGMDTFTPALTATVSNPTLGTGSSVEGYYIQMDKFVKGFGAIRFGTSGTAAGSGNYRISLPVAVDSTLYDTAAAAGIGVATSVTAGNGRQGTLRIQAVGGTTANVQDPSFTQWSNTNPGAWTANDRIYYEFQYKAA